MALPGRHAQHEENMKKAPIKKITAKAAGKATSKAAAPKTAPAAGIIYSIAAADLAGH